MSEGWYFRVWDTILKWKRKEKQADLTDLWELGTFTAGKLCSCMPLIPAAPWTANMP